MLKNRECERKKKEALIRGIEGRTSTILTL
jgi:hypothetical protein